MITTHIKKVLFRKKNSVQLKEPLTFWGWRRRCRKKRRRNEEIGKDSTARLRSATLKLFFSFFFKVRPVRCGERRSTDWILKLRVLQVIRVPTARWRHGVHGPIGGLNLRPEQGWNGPHRAWFEGSLHLEWSPGWTDKSVPFPTRPDATISFSLRAILPPFFLSSPSVVAHVKKMPGDDVALRARRWMEGDIKTDRSRVIKTTRHHAASRSAWWVHLLRWPTLTPLFTPRLALPIDWLLS